MFYNGDRLAKTLPHRADIATAVKGNDILVFEIYWSTCVSKNLHPVGQLTYCVSNFLAILNNTHTTFWYVILPTNSKA